ncbi:uncharacterized protein LAJ45_04647 [Morchella importuna]|uniref:uncharacterized protein n=1 Tax=Morchella importuna TaxID=1174673 RepID=UPI001E8D6B6A|nr:uncharacterized protein LAJ45_04647 [Morchella importuna]KAH8151442.1 hypothetical protein LAJ45_04647 [Morchella importuna]
MSSRRVSRQRQSAVGATDVLIMLQRMIDAKEREVAMLRDLLAEINHPAPPAAYHRPPPALPPMVHSRASTFMRAGPPAKVGVVDERVSEEYAVGGEREEEYAVGGELEGEEFSLVGYVRGPSGKGLGFEI